MKIPIKSINGNMPLSVAIAILEPIAKREGLRLNRLKEFTYCRHLFNRENKTKKSI